MLFGVVIPLGSWVYFGGSAVKCGLRKGFPAPLSHKWGNIGKTRF